jgi:glycogen synthase
MRQSTPVVGLVCRLTDQKGIDLTLEAIDGLLDMGVQLVVMGRGEPRYEEMMQVQARRHPGAMFYHQRDDETLTRLIYAGADILLAPSNFEPCGLGPLIGIRYGTVPVVRSTGGLADTICDYSQDPENGIGFSFESKTAEALVDGVERALKVYYRNQEWRRLILRLMKTDFSWERLSEEYVDLYRYAAAKRGAPQTRMAASNGRAGSTMRRESAETPPRRAVG